MWSVFAVHHSVQRSRRGAERLLRENDSGRKDNGSQTTRTISHVPPTRVASPARSKRAFLFFLLFYSYSSQASVDNRLGAVYVSSVSSGYFFFMDIAVL